MGFLRRIFSPIGDSSHVARMRPLVAFLSPMVVAIVLIMATTLKLNSLMVDGPSTPAMPLGSPGLLVVLIAFELTLATLICCGRPNAVTWLMAVLTFSAFGIYNTVLWTQGQATCLCFGNVSTRTATALLVDIGCIVCLMASALASRDSALSWWSLTWGARNTSLTAASVAIVLAGSAVPVLPGAAPFLARARGEGVGISAPLVEVREREADYRIEVEVNVNISNLWPDAVRIVGGLRT